MIATRPEAERPRRARYDAAGSALPIPGCDSIRERGAWYGAQIVETEAYLGIDDAAAHSWRGRRTERVAPLYMDGGHLYVFFVYGMHHCANVVTRSEGEPEAVLLRAAAAPSGPP